MIKVRNYKKIIGFTLLEILLYAAIVGVVLVMISSFIIDIINAKTKNDASLEVQNNANLAMERIIQTSRNATNILQPSLDNSGILNLDLGNGQTVTFFLQQKRLYIQENPPTSVAYPLTSSKVEVNSLIFKNLSPTPNNQILQISLEIQHKGIGQQYQSVITLQDSAQLRNKQ